MADVLATMKIMPESPEVDLEALKETIQNGLPEDAEFQNITEEPIAFGLVALNTMVIVEDGEGGTDAIEAAIAELEDVASVEVTATGRLM